MANSGNRLRMGISSVHLIDRSSLLRSIPYVNELGFWGIEIFGREIVSGELTDPAMLDQVRDTAEKHGVTLTVHPWFNWTELAEDEATEAFAQLLDRCHRLHAPYVNVHLNFLSTPSKGVERAARIVRPLITQLEQTGITLCFENVPANLNNPLGAHPQEFLTFFQLVGEHPQIGLTIDTGHANISGNLAEFTSRLAAKWMYTHLTDNHGESDDHLGAGLGSVDWSSFRQQLVSTGYAGPLIIEFNERYLEEAHGLLEELAQSA